MRVEIVNRSGVAQVFNGEKTGEYLTEGNHESKQKESIVKFDNKQGFLCMSTIHRLDYRVINIESGDEITS